MKPTLGCLIALLLLSSACNCKQKECTSDVTTYKIREVDGSQSAVDVRNLDCTCVEYKFDLVQELTK